MENHRRGLALLLCIAALVLIATTTMAADGNDDLFGEMDELLGPAKKTADASGEGADDLLDSLLNGEGSDSSGSDEAGAGVMQRLRDNFGGSLIMRGTHFSHDEPRKRYDADVFTRDTFGEARLELSSWTGTDMWRVSAAGWAETDNLDDNWKRASEMPRFFRDKDRERQHVELNELYLRLYRPAFDLTVGKTMLTNGVGILYSPADRYTPGDFTDPFAGKDLGRWLLQADATVKAFTLTAAVLPVYTPSKTPHDHARWMTSDTVGSSAFPGAGGATSVDPETPEVTWQNIGFFARAKTTVRGWDLFVSGYHGLANNSVTHVKSRIQYFRNPLVPWIWVPVRTYDPQSVVPRATHVAGGFSTTWGRLEFHGESLYNITHGGRDDSYVASMIGGTVTLDYDWIRALHIEKIEFTAEYGGEWRIEDMDKEGHEYYIASSETSRIGRDDLFLRADIKLSEDLLVRGLMIHQLALEGRMYVGEVEWEVRPNTMLKVSYQEFRGADGGYLGRWNRNDRYALTLERTF